MAVGAAQAQSERKAEHPLTDRCLGQYAVDKVRRGRSHAPSAARWTESPPLAGECHETVATTGKAMHAREAVGEYATLEKAQELSSNEAREPRAAERVELREKGLGVLFQKAIEQRLRRVAATVTSDASFAGRRRHSAWTGTRRRWLQPVSAAPRMSLTVLGRQGEITQEEE